MTEQQIFRDQQKHHFLNFIGEKCVDTETPLTIKALIDEYMSSGTSPAPGALGKWVVEYKKRICQLKELDINIKAKLLFGLSTTVNSKCLKELRDVADVDIDKRRRITKFYANDGSLRLEGTHSKIFRTLRTEDDDDDVEEVQGHEVVSPVGKRSRVKRLSEESVTDLIVADGDENTEACFKTRVQPNLTAVTVKEKLSEKHHQNLFTVETETIDELTPNAATNDNDHLRQPHQKHILPFASQKEFLHYLLNLIKVMKLPMNQNIMHIMNRIIGKIEKLQALDLHGERNVDMEKFQTVVEAFVAFTRENASEKNHEDSRSLRELLMLLEMGIMSLGLPELQDLQTKIDECMKDPANQNKRVPVSKIERVLKTILDVLT